MSSDFYTLYVKLYADAALHASELFLIYPVFTANMPVFAQTLKSKGFITQEGIFFNFCNF